MMLLALLALLLLLLPDPSELHGPTLYTVSPALRPGNPAAVLADYSDRHISVALLHCNPAVASCPYQLA